MIRSLYIALGGLVLTSSSACFFTDVINEAPVPGIRVLVDGPYRVGDQLLFDATKSADDSRVGLQARWTALTCLDGRTPRCVPAGDEIEGELDATFALEITSHETIEVQLRVVDEHGATRTQPDIFTVQVSNRPPEIDLQVTGYREAAGGPFVLQRDINLILGPKEPTSLHLDPDEDSVELDWQLLPPAGSDSAARSFEPLGDTGYVLKPDVAGTWSVIATADDGYGGTDEIRKDFVVAPDGPPCFEGMDPQPLDDAYYVVDSADGARRFSVLSVRDALDAFPAAIDEDPILGESRFRWLLQAPGGGPFVEIPGYTESSYLVDPSVFSPGEQFALRVEVRDRVEGPERALPCAEDVWSCALDTASQCFQRRTWGVDIR